MFSRFVSVGSEEAPIEGLASVRHSNGTCSSRQSGETVLAVHSTALDVGRVVAKIDYTKYKRLWLR